MTQFVDLKSVSGFIPGVIDSIGQTFSRAIDYVRGELLPEAADRIGAGAETVASAFDATVHTGGEIIDTLSSGLSGFGHWVATRFSSPEYTTGAPPTWDPSGIGVIDPDAQLYPDAAIPDTVALIPPSASHYEMTFGL
ncbi:hypothetical protein ACFQU1_19595 [Chelatococcus sp. GCM10030263]|uniref:hypothetical protein n=1 Tax=Chelatococcus sp. GCM10030263 TaxID=3273387 RepID=UPI00361D7955